MYGDEELPEFIMIFSETLMLFSIRLDTKDIGITVQS